MQGKYRLRLTAEFWAGIIFSLCGIGMIVLAVVLMIDQMPYFAWYAFLYTLFEASFLLAIGVLFVWAMGSLLVREVKKLAGEKRAFQTGTLRYAQYDSCFPVRTARRHRKTDRIIAVFTYVDENGFLHEVRSRPMHRRNEKLLQGAQVPLYLDNENREYYFLDTYTYLKEMKQR